MSNEVEEKEIISKRVEFRLENELLKLIDVKSKLLGISRSEYLRNIIIKDLKNTYTNIDEKTIKKIRKLTIEDRKMRIAFNKLGVVLNQSIKMFLGEKKEEFERLEDEFFQIFEKEKKELEEYKKFLL